MDKDFEILNVKDVSEVKRLVNQYALFIGDQNVGIKIYLGADGFYQMSTSHYYRGKDKAGVYITSAANFNSEHEALTNAIRQLTMFYDGEGEWRKNEDFNI
ncbi:hypothetical protein [Mangrovibacillus cuniculi]|uniref:Uncharacterized protein n=1 Tax=Mangrovibacillus cuniculi TaxID=2593652 RepID=A0A7S8HG58_9BACI|nr:hypothetical protein [Mangrovibacillus cuniculi]QPC47120.1 hypothetical protein G8O30_09145 [Mangrovibacillus cuniculi]